LGSRLCQNSLGRKRVDQVAEEQTEEDGWCSDQREHVIQYLRRENVSHGRVGEWPAWHVYPCVAIWAIESVKAPGWVGWWAISGDLPCDYISATDASDPRTAARVIADSWLEVSEHLIAGREHPTVRIGLRGADPDLGRLLLARARMLRALSEDAQNWTDNREASR